MLGSGLLAALLEWGSLAALGSLGSPRPLSEAVSTIDDGCLEHARVVESTRGWLGSDAVDPKVRATVTADSPNALRVQLYIEGSLSVDRVLDPAPSNCSDRHAAVGLLIAMAIDQQLDAGPLPAPEPRPPPPDQAPAPPEPTRTVSDDERAPKLEARSKPSSSPAKPRGIALFVGPMVGFEVLPGVAFGGRLGLSLQAASWLEVDAGALGLAGLSFELGVGEVRPSLVGAEAGLCPTRRWSRWQVRLCVGPAAAAVIAQGRGFDEERRSLLPWVALNAAPDVRVGLTPRIALGLRAGVSAPLLSAGFDVRNDGGIVIDRRTPSSAGGFAGIDLAIALRGTK